ncbi:MAG: hypothetical protein OEV49_07575 [candidate division Zixibacteria bacterium]|nr:hypothetical protein [candidate division Zixibacteria bacterium]MDH3936073.1 hypothetical protein [candidate division Zixibacteria bacterium]MDH4032219.1 hypothetical protein [candidate division Zixibacteria bacterium]
MRLMTVIIVTIGLFMSRSVAGQDIAPGSAPDGIQDSTVRKNPDTISESTGTDSIDTSRTFALHEELASGTSTILDSTLLHESGPDSAFGAETEPVDTSPMPELSLTDSEQNVKDESKSIPALISDWWDTDIGELLPDFTSIVLFLTFLVAFITYRQKTKPIIKFNLIPNPQHGIPTGLTIRPHLHNLSDTDALGIVIIEFVLSNGERKQFKSDEGAYCGGWIWTLQAQVEISGVTNVSKMIDEFSPKASLEANTEGNEDKNQLISIECVVYTVRWRNWRSPCLRWLVSIYPIVYRTPTYKWNLVNESGGSFALKYGWERIDLKKWVFKPDHESMPIPQKPNIKVFKNALRAKLWE